MHLFLLVAPFGWAADYHVDPGGDDGADGSPGAPWATLQHAADTVAAGDTVHVRAGTLQGFDLRTSGTAKAPITFRGEAGAIIDRDNPSTPDGINLEGVDHVVLEDLTVVGTGRAGIRAVLCQHVTIRRIVSRDNGRWGVFTGFCDDLRIEDNETSGSIDEHGIYVSNSGDRPVIRGNRIWGNRANGIHMNGDVSQGGDGVISDALVEANLLWDNGTGGGSAINGDGIQDAVIRNNVIWETHASGISLYQTDGGAPSTGNLVINNTVVVADDGRWAVNIQDGSTGNTVRNNILWNAHSFRGSIDVCADCLAGLVSEHNVVMDRFTVDGGDSVLTLAEWQALGFGSGSLLSTPAALFVDPGAQDLHLRTGAPAIDAGSATDAPSADVEGVVRPYGPAVDIGAYEWCEGATCDGDTTPTDTGTDTDTDIDIDTDPDPDPDGDPTPDVDTDAGKVADPEEEEADDGGCGCAGVPGSGTTGWLVLLALVRRRTGRAHPAC